MSDRPSKTAWVLDERMMPRFCTGYQCVPENPDYWWFPEIGWSVPEREIFTNEADARAVAIAKLTIERRSITERIEKLEAQS